MMCDVVLTGGVVTDIITNGEAIFAEAEAAAAQGQGFSGGMEMGCSPETLSSALGKTCGCGLGRSSAAGAVARWIHDNPDGLGAVVLRAVVKAG